MYVEIENQEIKSYVFNQENTNESTDSILFVHGFGGSAVDWQEVLGLLPKDFSLRLIDLPGHGFSENSLGLSFKQLTDHLGNFILNFCKTPVILVGHSLGGLLAQSLVLQYPQLIKKLILISTAHNIVLHPSMVEQIMKNKFDEEFILAGFDRAVSVKVKEAVLEGFKKLKVKDMMFFQSLENVNFLDFLSEILIPTLVIFGKDDKIVSPRRTNKVAQLISNAKSLAIENCGHYPHLEHPQLVSQAINNFIATN